MSYIKRSSCITQLIDWVERFGEREGEEYSYKEENWLISLEILYNRVDKSLIINGKKESTYNIKDFELIIAVIRTIESFK